MYKTSFISQEKEKEIIVFIRLQSEKDKYEILDFIEKKFDLDTEHAETLYYKALPDGLTLDQRNQIKEISSNLSKNTSFQEVDSILDDCSVMVLEENTSPTIAITEFLTLAQQISNLT